MSKLSALPAILYAVFLMWHHIYYTCVIFTNIKSIITHLYIPKCTPDNTNIWIHIESKNEYFIYTVYNCVCAKSIHSKFQMRFGSRAVWALWLKEEDAWVNGIILIAWFMWPTWGPSGANRTRVGAMLAPWTLLPEGFLCLYSLSGRASYHTIPWSLKIARFGFKLLQFQLNCPILKFYRHHDSASRLREIARFGDKTSCRLVNRGQGDWKHSYAIAKER